MVTWFQNLGETEHYSREQVIAQSGAPHRGLAVDHTWEKKKPGTRFALQRHDPLDTLSQLRFISLLPSSLKHCSVLSPSTDLSTNEGRALVMRSLLTSKKGHFALKPRRKGFMSKLQQFYYIFFFVVKYPGDSWIFPFSSSLSPVGRRHLNSLWM